MTAQYRICPTNRLIIESKADLPNARWCFYRVCDSPNDAKRSLYTINGIAELDALWPTVPSHLEGIDRFSEYPIAGDEHAKTKSS